MTVALNEALVARAKRKPNEDTLTNDECIAINLFWRRDVKVPILAKVFRVSKNTIYYRAITGAGASYPTSIYANEAQEVNALVDKMGVDKAWHKYVSNEMVAAVEAEIEMELAKRDAERS